MAKVREKDGEKVTLFAPRAYVQRLQRAIPYTTGLRVNDFSTYTSPVRFRQSLSQAVEWLERLPNLDDFETVICDNLPEILARRPDATLSAQFFWHGVINDAALEYADYCEQLLTKYKPKIIGCELFAMDAVRKQPGFKSVGLYKNPELIAATNATSQEERTDLLVTGGTTPTLRKKLQPTIKKLLNNGPGPYKYIHIDPELMPKAPPHWILPADFSISMYCKLKAAICRPGLGVITDLITVGASIYPIYESNNLEMEHNSRILETIYIKKKPYHITNFSQ